MSLRKSGRRGGGKGKMIAMAGATLFIGAIAVAYFLSGGGKAETADAAIADALPEAPSSAGTQSRPLPAAHDIDRALREISDAVQGSKDEAHTAALIGGYAKLVPMLEGPLAVADRERAIAVFHAITKELFLSCTHNEFSNNYVAKSGDSFEKIAARAGISVNLLTDLNNLARGCKTLQIGQNLKLPKGAPRVVVSKSEYCASLYFGNNLVRQYVVAHGKNNNTPEGRAKVTNMCVDPEKTSRGANDPTAEMKLRWIGLSKFGERSGFGLHGTQYPDSIPGQTSKGCIRMKDEDVVELYDMLRPGNEVEIRA
jgi:LysM repeat protein